VQGCVDPGGLALSGAPVKQLDGSGKTIANKQGFLSGALNAAVRARVTGTGLGAPQERPGSGLRTMRGGRIRPSRRMGGKPGGATLNDCWNQVAGFGGRRP
jgi:hypothetical protein